MINYFLKLLAVFFGLILLSSCDTINLYFDGDKTTVNEQEAVFFIPSNTGLDDLAELLFNEGLVSDKSPILTVGEYKNLDRNRIAAGKYIIAPNTDIKTLLNGFTINSRGNGNKEVAINLTFNNCRDIPQLAGKVAHQLELDSVELVNYILSDEVLAKYGFSTERILALFLPNTYQIYWDIDKVAFVEQMAKVFKTFWSEERMNKLTKIGLNSQSDAVTLASIVYKEQDKHEQEWAIIAGLYLNRLKNDWKLESDPTFRFCWGDKLHGVKRLTKEHRQIDCPYNTYLYGGLPPGPICIPPAGVIDAVLNPENNNYFFMCAKPDGNGLHNFAKSFAEHQRNANEYHRWLTKHNIR